jgi:hypothetical protein
MCFSFLWKIQLKERHHDYTLKRHAKEIVRETADLSLDVITKVGIT